MLREYTTAQNGPVTTDRSTIYTLLSDRTMRDPDDIVAQYQPEGSRRWRSVTASEMDGAVRSAAKGLMALGIGKGDRVTVYSATHYHWGVVDFACAAIGAVSVPIYETDSSAQAQAIIAETHPKVAFTDTAERTLAIEQIRQGEPALEYVFNFEAGGLEALDDWGVSVPDADLDERIDAVRADDMLTIVYTSGSTGKPKGAMITHRNYMHIVLAGFSFMPDMLGNPSRLLLFLPLAHCFARYVQYCTIGREGVVGYIPSAKHLLSDLRSFQPTYLLGVPRVFEKVYNAASQKAGAGFKGRVFAKAFRHFAAWSRAEQDGRGHSPIARIEHAFFERAVGDTVRSALGARIKYLACGGAPINADLAHFFNGLDGITFIQGYGLTETSAPCCVNQEAWNRVGTVGHPGTGIGVRLADDDELQIKGPNVFVGYLDNPEKTREAFTEDGWLRTGDLAQIDDDGFVTITGRKKDIIITAGGKNVSPAPMEDTIMTCPIVQHAVVVGDGKPFISALITLETDMLRDWLKAQNLPGDMPLEEAARNDAVRAFVQQWIDKANLHVSRAESVRKFVILPEQFNQDDGTLTPSLKVVRPKVLRRYEPVIDGEIYTAKPGTQPAPTASTVLLNRTSEAVANANAKLQQEVTPIVETAIGKLNEQRRKARVAGDDGSDGSDERTEQEAAASDPSSEA